MSDIPELDSDKLKLPEGSKVVIAPEKITEKVKKERTEAQKAAFEKMRAKRLENDDKRKITKGDKQKEMDDIKIQLEKDEEDERLKRAQELKDKLGVDVEVLKKRGRKAGSHIPYKGTSGKSTGKESGSTTSGKEEVKEEKIVEVVSHSQPTYSNPYMNMLLSKMRRF
jgi:hypothetical protein